MPAKSSFLGASKSRRPAPVSAHKAPVNPRPKPKPLSHAPPPPAGGHLRPPAESARRCRSQEPSRRQPYPASPSSPKHSPYDRPKRDDTRWRSVSPRARSSPLRNPDVGLRRRMTRDSEFSADDESRPTSRRASPSSLHRVRQRQPPRPQPLKAPVGARPGMGRYQTDSYRPDHKRRPSHDAPRTPRHPPGFRPARASDSPYGTPTTPRSRSREPTPRRREPVHHEQTRHAGKRPFRHAENSKPAESPSSPQQSSPAGFEFLEKLPQVLATHLGLKSLSDSADKAKEWADWVGDIKEAPEEISDLTARTTTTRDTITQIQSAIEARPDLMEGESGQVLRKQIESAIDDAKQALKKMTKLLQDLDNDGNRGRVMNGIEEFYHSYKYKNEWENKIKAADAELEKQIGTLSMLMVNIYSRSLMKPAPPGVNNPIPPPVPGGRSSETDGRRFPTKLDPPPVGRYSVSSAETGEESDKKESDKKESEKKEPEAESKDKAGDSTKGSDKELKTKAQQPTPPPAESKDATPAKDTPAKADPEDILLDAAWNGDLEACADALRTTSPNIRDPRGLTPLHLAAERDNLAIAMLLTDHGADPQTHSISGRTPLHLASRYGSSAIVEYLVDDARADPNARAADGRTPLHYAALAGDDEGREVVRVLRNWKADPTIKDVKGRTARDLAQRRDCWGVSATLRRAEKKWEEDHRENWLQRHGIIK